MHSGLTSVRNKIEANNTDYPGFGTGNINSKSLAVIKTEEKTVYENKMTIKSNRPNQSAHHLASRLVSAAATTLKSDDTGRNSVGIQSHLSKNVGSKSSEQKKKEYNVSVSV